MKVFFGLLGETIRKKVADKWSVSKADAFKSLEVFLAREYDMVEKIMAS